VTDSRKDDRLLVKLVMRYREPTMLEPREGECRDLSLSGMFIGTARPSPRGALIRFESVSEKGDEAFRGTGRVVWQRPKADDRGPAGMGVRFVRLEAGGREAVERTMERIGARRPISKTPRPNPSANAPSSRARLEDAPTQAVPIFAAGTGASGSGAPAAGATSQAAPAAGASGPAASNAPEATATATATGAADAATAKASGHEAGASPAESATTSQFPQHRSATLRGIPKSEAPLRPNDAKPASNQPATASSRPPRGDETPIPGGGARPGLSPLPPAPKRNGGGGGAGDELRHRLGRTRRGVGPSGLVDDVSLAAAIASERVSRNNEGVDRTTQPNGTDTMPPASAAAGAHDKPAREPQSDRPPRPGGVDDLRPRGAGQNGSSRPPAGAAFGRTTVTETRRHEEWPPLRPRALAAEAGREETERRIPMLDEAERYSLPDPDQQRANPRALFWVIAGSGLLISLAMIKLFGGVLPGIPEDAGAEQPSAGDPSGGTNSPGAASEVSRAPHMLVVVTKPAGATVTAAGKTVIAPGTLIMDGLQAPLQVTAELSGYNKASTTVSDAQFARKGDTDTFEGRIELTLQPVVKLASRTATATPALASSTPTVQTPSNTAQASAASGQKHERSSTPPRRSTPPRTPSRTPHRTPPADLPAPSSSDESSESSPVVAISERPEGAPPAPNDDDSDNGSQQTPLAQALECLSRGDNRCVIRALEDKASSAREYELLIETYRAVGSTPRAERQMQLYLERYPDGQRAAEYRRLLERRAPAAASSAPAPEESQE
jgi:hypothetical protein